VDITSQNNQAHLRITFRERSLDESIGLSVSVSSLGFSGAVQRVWVFKQDLERFISDVEQLDLLRKGSAKLTSMTPGECIWEIKVTDSAGHIRMFVHLERPAFHFRGVTFHRLDIDFEPDAGCFGQLLHDLREILSDAATPASED
jgi:hypothetical protein